MRASIARANARTAKDEALQVCQQTRGVFRCRALLPSFQ